MGGYGFTIAKGKRFYINMHINLSNEYPSISFQLYDNNDKFIEDFENYARAEYGKPLNEAIKDIENEVHLCYIEDKIIHEKAVFEKEYLDMKEKLENAEKYIQSLKQKIEDIKRLL